MPVQVPVLREGKDGEPASLRVCIFQTKAQAKEWGDELNALNETYQELDDIGLSVHTLLPWLQSAHRWLGKWYMGPNVPDELDLFIADDTKEMIHSVENSLDLLETKFPEEGPVTSMVLDLSGETTETGTTGGEAAQPTTNMQTLMDFLEHMKRCQTSEMHTDQNENLSGAW